MRRPSLLQLVLLALALVQNAIMHDHPHPSDCKNKGLRPFAANLAASSQSGCGKGTMQTYTASGRVLL
eukprot:3741088-Amphidinium_carterae.1